MHVVGFRGLCELPPGTIFSYLQDGVVDDLLRLGDVIRRDDGTPIDFYETSLIASNPNGEGYVVELDERRWGLFDYDAKFLVYDLDDVNKIVRGLTRS